ncbi:MAG: HEAT repeat domain-containing protein [Gammaproteobacteria bacterium]|nr:HEAT repeat domain-containing protein [Gammaproteobacteria bacterium]
MKIKKMFRPSYQKVKKFASENDSSNLIRVLSYHNDEDYYVALICAADALGRIKEKNALSSLDPLMDYDNSNVRRAAVRALGGIGSATSVSSLIQAMKNDSSASVRHEAVTSLARVKDARAASALLDEWQSLSENVSDDELDRSLVESFSRILLNLKAEKEVTVALKPGYGTIRHLVVQEICDSKKVWAIRLLIKTMMESAPERSTDLGPFFAALQDGIPRWKPSGGVEKTFFYAAKRRFNECVEIGEPAVLPLILILRGDYSDEWAWDYRARAALALGAIGDERAIEYIVEELQETWSSSPSFASLYIRALKRFGKSAVSQLVSSVQAWFEDPTIQYTSHLAQLIYALKRLGDPSAIEAIIPALDLPGGWDYDVATLPERVVDALRTLSGKPYGGDPQIWREWLKFRDEEEAIQRSNMVDILIEALRTHDSRFIRYQVIVTLGNLGATDAVPFLVKELKTKHYDDVVVALGQIGDSRAVKPLMRDDVDVYHNVGRALGRIGDARAIPLLVKLLQKNADTSAARTYVEALARIGDKQAKVAIKKYYSDGGSFAREQVREGLDAAGKRSWF